jgi:superfamily II RNA helicase
MILGIHSIRGHRVLVDALLPHGAVVRLKAGAVKQLLTATPPLAVPRDRGRDPRGLRHLAEQLAELDVRTLIERERARRPEAALASIECHQCPWGSTSRCDQAWREVARLGERVEQRREALETIRGAYWHEFLRVVEVLEQFGAVREGRLETKGRLIATLRHDNELLVAEVVARGLLADLTLPEAAAVCSTLSEEARSGEPVMARMFLRGRPKLRRKLEQVAAVADAVAEAQRQRRLPMPVSVHPGFMPAVFRWASGDDGWPAIVQQAFGGHEGDLIRAMRRLIDVLRQLAESAEVPPATARLLGQAARVIDRGIVLESALI